MKEQLINELKQLSDKELSVMQESTGIESIEDIAEFLIGIQESIQTIDNN